jgi:hypothetical protein
MNGKGKESAQRLLAIIVIIAMLAMIGIPPTVILFFALVTFFIWRAAQNSEHEDTARIFKFYIAANDILRDEERRWYGYEIEEVIERGEQVFHSLPDPPPLLHFALGALYKQASNYETATEHLAYVVENETSDERHRFVASPELRRYVQTLRKLEREPTEAPQTLAALRSLERARRNRAASMLAESREKLKASVPQTPTRLSNAASEQNSLFADFVKKTDGGNTATTAGQNYKPQAPHTPITEVLRDVYEGKKTA